MSRTKNFSWIDTSVAGTAAINPNGRKTLLADCVSIFFIYGKSAEQTSLRKFTKPPFWLVSFSVVQ